MTSLTWPAIVCETIRKTVDFEPERVGLARPCGSQFLRLLQQLRWSQFKCIGDPA